MRKILYTRPDGNASVVHPVRNTLGESLTITDAEIEQRAWIKIPSDAINPQFIDPVVIPTDRTFRNAWTQNGVMIVHDMPKCREIQEQRIEAKRRLKMLDLMVRENLGENVAVDKAAIRAINARALCQAAQTPEELKAVLPERLR